VQPPQNLNFWRKLLQKFELKMGFGFVFAARELQEQHMIDPEERSPGRKWQMEGKVGERSLLADG
jgi:hypothetical protein